MSRVVLVEVGESGNSTPHPEGRVNCPSRAAERVRFLHRPYVILHLDELGYWLRDGRSLFVQSNGDT